MRLIAFIMGLALVAAPATAAPPPPGAARLDAATRAAINCTDLQKRDFGGLAEAPTTIRSATIVSASGENKEYCRIEGTVAPQIRFELRLPTASWNGRYFQTGCGGMCGAVMTDQYCSDAQARDFAVAAHDMGHEGTVWQGAPWGANPAQREDFGKRSSHVVAVAAKAIVKAYYGQPAARSYFRGCSTGGREGISLAQHYPSDFDGIVAGDFAMPVRQGGISNTWDAQHLLDLNDEDIFTRQKLEVLHRAVIKSCDGLDGLVDGILTDPRQCSFDPRSLLCPGADTGDCLTKQQVDAAIALYQGPRNSKGQRLAPGGRAFGSELAWDGGVYGGGKNRLEMSESALRNLVFAQVRPDFGYRDMDWDRDIAALEAQVAVFDVMPVRTAPDLRAFEKAGGRLIAYHGWADPGVPAVGTLDYYAQVYTRQGGLDRTRNWFRVFMVPGMFHCRNGDAPNTFDMLSAIVAWVEQGVAPDGIVATQYAEDKSVKRTRPLYAYPAIAQYKGVGDVNRAENWQSAQPTKPVDDLIDWIWAPTR